MAYIAANVLLCITFGVFCLACSTGSFWLDVLAVLVLCGGKLEGPETLVLVLVLFLLDRRVIPRFSLDCRLLSPLICTIKQEGQESPDNARRCHRDRPEQETKDHKRGKSPVVHKPPVRLVSSVKPS